MFDKMKDEGTSDAELLDRLEVDIKKLEQVNQQLTRGDDKPKFEYPKDKE